MKRSNLLYLEKWFLQKDRKPLVLRGARQVGKTHLVRQFAETRKLDLIEINFEFQPEAMSLFESYDVVKIKNLIKLTYGKSLGLQSVLFLDELQAAPSMFKVLRFLYEVKVDFAIIAAGSLLEFTFSETEMSVPVGRLEYHFLGPVNFKEFLNAKNENDLIAFIESFHAKDIIPPPVHNKISNLFQEYLSIGGMPEVVHSFLNRQDFNDCDRIKNLIINTYEDDFHKYKKRVPWERIRKVFRSIPQQLGNKFKYSKVTTEEKAKSLSQALDLLCMAQVAHKVSHSSAQGLPLGSQIHENYFKILFLDFGLCNTLLGLNTSNLYTSQNLNSLFKGELFEQIVGQHLLFSSQAYMPPELYTWAREKAGSSAEVDFLITCEHQIIPIEVKSGSTGHLKSLLFFLEERSLPLGIRINTEPPSLMTIKQSQLLSLPIYMVTEIRRLCSELLN